MTSAEVYQIWRPEAWTWSRWVKPVVFAFLRKEDLERDEYAVPEWQAVLHSDTAIIADLPGEEGIRAGMALARAGYLPVPVYNACPTGEAHEADSRVAIDMSGILAAICGASRELASFDLSRNAPPVFILDSRRHGSWIGNESGSWDNRSFVTASDFPSAEYLRSHGISNVILVQTSSQICGDLREVLLQLQRDGMTLARLDPWKEWDPSKVVVKPPMILVSAWEWLSRKAGYRRNRLDGTFGGVVPRSSSS